MTANMTYGEYKRLIDKWTKAINEAGFRLSDDKEIPVTFWKTFLGIKRKVHQDMYACKHNTKGEINPNKLVPAYYAKTIYFVERLEHAVFLEEVKKHISLFEADKTS